MKYGIIGTGWIAESFIKGVRLKTDSVIAAVYSRTEEKGGAFARKYNIPAVYTDLDAFAGGDFDAVYIASPNVLHYSHSMKMLEAGKHVLCEKPAGVNPDEIRMCIKTADEKNLIYAEAIMYMHSPVRNILRGALDNLGRISSARFDFTQLSSKYPAYLKGENPNIFNPALATGCFMDLGIYCVYPAVDLFGMPEKVEASSIFLDTGADCSGSAILNYGDKIISLTYSKIAQDYAGSFIYGDKGTIEIESISKLINISLIDNSGKKTCLRGEDSKEEIMGFEAESFESFAAGLRKEEYELLHRRMTEVGELMYKIRQISGIKFLKEN